MKRYIPILKLAALILIGPAIIYSATLSKTIKIWNEYRAIDRENTVSRQDSIRHDSLSSEAMISSGKIMDTVMAACSPLEISVGNYSPELDASAPGMEIFKANMILYGRFKPLLNIIDKTVNAVPQVKVISAEFSCDERMYKKSKIMMKMEIVQLETTERKP